MICYLYKKVEIQICFCEIHRHIREHTYWCYIVIEAAWTFFSIIIIEVPSLPLPEGLWP